ncbi:MAG: hypothetical protein K0S48_4165, partial [Ramlibacter sp.]|nr:hypothetical protein [Ramlibacter sp.]
MKRDRFALAERPSGAGRDRGIDLHRLADLLAAAGQGGHAVVEVGRAGFQPHDLGDVHPAMAPAHLQRGHGAGLHAVAGLLQHGGTRDHRPPQLLAGRLQAGGGVDGVADRRGFLHRRGAQAADGDLAGMQADADGERRQAAAGETLVEPVAEFVGGQRHGQRGRHRAARRRRARPARRVGEHGHEAVADELEVHAAVPQHGLAGVLEIAHQQLGHLARIQLLGQRGEVADVGEQHRGGQHLVGDGPQRRIQAGPLRRGVAGDALGKGAAQLLLARLHRRFDGQGD